MTGSFKGMVKAAAFGLPPVPPKRPSTVLMRSPVKSAEKLPEHNKR
eukprot:CAMPEP_0170456422 /NCGR_PEP_ID=MMETSP0123-20130129/4062_1 /TAXON_ID=182087 /ORGANISM="Favella ehrenbergii, Strain Fehren 1" /LENGTH=45 /DNA_ID= /DNA_START= /DNA_END= /DNA_ORIENTATION=